jgi:hypothetical protein
MANATVASSPKAELVKCEIGIQSVFDGTECARPERARGLSYPLVGAHFGKLSRCRRVGTPCAIPRLKMKYSRDWLQISRRISTCVFLTAKVASANWASEIDRAPLDGQEEIADQLPAETQRGQGLRFDERRFGLQLRLGAATTVGEIGIVSEYDVLDWLNIGLGIGTNASGLMPGAHVRLRPLVVRNESGRVAHAIMGEAGLSAGYYDPGILSMDLDGGGPDPPKYVPKQVIWWQAEVGWEARWSSGLTLRASMGIAQCFVDPVLRYTSEGKQYETSGDGPPPTTIVETLGVGYAF